MRENEERLRHAIEEKERQELASREDMYLYGRHTHAFTIEQSEQG